MFGGMYNKGIRDKGGCMKQRWRRVFLVVGIGAILILMFIPREVLVEDNNESYVEDEESDEITLPDAESFRIYSRVVRKTNTLMDEYRAKQDDREVVVEEAIKIIAESESYSEDEVREMYIEILKYRQGVE